MIDTGKGRVEAEEEELEGGGASPSSSSSSSSAALLFPPPPPPPERSMRMEKESRFSSRGLKTLHVTAAISTPASGPTR